MMSVMAKRKNPMAVALGRRGGKKKVPKGFSMLSQAQRRELGRKAAAARWGKKEKSK
jgi:hypothetical protein